MIRPATEADLQAILDIYNDAVINTSYSYNNFIPYGGIS